MFARIVLSIMLINSMFGAAYASQSWTISPNAIDNHDPPVIVTNHSDIDLFVKWQTSVPGVAASPLEQVLVKSGEKNKELKHGNFWMIPKDSRGNSQSITNKIEVWVSSSENPNVFISRFESFRLLYPENLAKEDEKIYLYINVSENIGIDVRISEEE